ncbi:MAG: hypothetical protein PHD20_02805 [Clostridia bacterium]|nr:hypothetical protein [Clostridia bacterium]
MTITGMVITHQDYINITTILILYAIAGWILIGVSALAVKHFWHDPISNNPGIAVKRNKAKRAA